MKKHRIRGNAKINGDINPITATKNRIKSNKVSKVNILNYLNEQRR